jgi:molybdopterin-guanine dinucleotide biosynthesis protein B
MIPVISFVGRSDSGKTTYLTKLISEMKLRGYRVGVIKHDVHGFEMDRPGKDTWRHAQAGADVVCISSPLKMALIKKVQLELSLPEVVGHIDDVDIIFTEGYKREGAVKVEVFRQAVCQEPVCRQEELLAMVSDVEVYQGLPTFSLIEAVVMADFLEDKFFGNGR